MSYIEIDYSIISAQLVNGIVLGIVFFNENNPDFVLDVAFEKVSPLAITYSISSDSESRTHTLKISGPDATDAELIKESSKDIDHIDREIMRAIGKAINLTVVPAYLKMAKQTAITPISESSKTLQ